MKKINFLKAALIVLAVGIISALAVFVIIQLNKEPEVQEEVVLPTPSEIPEQDPYEGSLVDRKDSISRINEFDYNMKISSIKETKKVSEEYDWVEKQHEKITLADDLVLYLNDYVVTSGYTTSINNGMLTIKTNAEDYILNIKPIYNKEFERIIGIDNYNEENDIRNEYDKILEEYNTIYNETDGKSSLEFNGISTYSKMVDFIEENNLQKDIGLYSSIQTKEIIEKVFNVSLDDSYGNVEGYTMIEGDIISSRIEKHVEDNEFATRGSSECYYLISNGTQIYACHLVAQINYQSDIDFQDMLSFVTIAIQLY